MVAVAFLASLSGPRVNRQLAAEPPPPIEDLIPQGERKDSALMLRVLSGDEIVEMSMERFLIGVVAAEMPASFEIEALKAQAVAARTNVMYKLRVAGNPNHPDADVCTDPACCMAYSSDDQLRARWSADYIANITKIINAVIETDGIYMTYGDEPIDAVFHSSSNGKTETSGNVWMTDLPYLRSVDSPETQEQVPGYVSTVTVSREDFIATVTAAYPNAVFDGDEETWISDISYTESGRVSALNLCGVTVKGTALRSLFNLRSAAITIDLSGGDFTFTTVGFGHGVGMSQYGANAMAIDGDGYAEILSHYYTGIEFTGGDG